LILTSPVRHAQAALRLAESRRGGPLQRTEDTAIATGEGWPLAEACG
jgi:hypothetical protein